MSGPSPAFRWSVQTAWIRFVFTGSITMAGWDCAFAATMIATSGEKLPPPSVDLEKKTSLLPFRLSVHAMEMLFPRSRASDGSDWAAAPGSLLTRDGVDHVLPSEDFVKKTSDWVTVPPHPANAKYATPSEPIAMDGFAAVYAGGRSTRKLGPKCGAAGPAEATCAKAPTNANARNAASTAIGRIRLSRRARAVGTRGMRAALLSQTPLPNYYLTETGRFSKSKTSVSRWLARVHSLPSGSSRRSDSFIPASPLGPDSGHMAGERSQSYLAGAPSPHSTTAEGPEAMTLAERFIASFRLPYALGCILIGFGLFGTINTMLFTFAETSDLRQAILIAFSPSNLAQSVLVAYAFYAPRYMRTKLLAAGRSLPPIPTESERGFRDIFGRVSSR